MKKQIKIKLQVERLYYLLLSDYYCFYLYVLNIYNQIRRLPWPQANTEKYIFKSCQIRTDLDCNYTFPIDLAPNSIPFGVAYNVIIIQIWSNVIRFRNIYFFCAQFRATVSVQQFPLPNSLFSQTTVSFNSFQVSRKVFFNSRFTNTELFTYFLFKVCKFYCFLR